MTLTTQELQTMDASHHLHPFTDSKSLNAAGVRVITRAKGIHVWTAEGHELIDGMSGLWNVNVGHGLDEIIDAISRQLRQLDYYNTFFKTTHPGATELAARLAKVAPAGLRRVFYTDSGSAANDTVIRLVRHYWAVRDKPQRSLLVSRHNAYHGSTVGAASLSGMSAMHKQGGLPIPGVVHAEQPYWWKLGGDRTVNEFGLWAAAQVADTIDRAGADRVAAFIGEPVMGAGGVVIPPDNYWPEVQRICRERGVLMVSDEVICGFGRLGRWFGCEHFGVQPDLITFAKGVTSGYYPLGGVLVSDAIADTLNAQGGEFHHGFTNSGHPGACAAALANLDYMERENLVRRVRDDVGPYLRRRWLELADHPLVGEARMVGLMGALELTPHKASRGRFAIDGAAGRLCHDLAFQNGVIVRALGDVMVLAPPLSISHTEIDSLIARLIPALDATYSAHRRGSLI